MLQVLHMRFPAVSVLGFALDDPATVAQIKPVVYQGGITFPVFSGTVAQRQARKYNVQTYPTLFLLDRQGKVVWSHSGMLDAIAERKLETVAVSLA